MGEAGIPVTGNLFTEIGSKYPQSMKPAFKQSVLAVVARIPKGKTLTYKEVAGKAGRPLACRAVGNILSKNMDPKIPCHRVIGSNGNPGGYNRGSARKKMLLESEGIIFR